LTESSHFEGSFNLRFLMLYISLTPDLWWATKAGTVAHVIELRHIELGWYLHNWYWGPFIKDIKKNDSFTPTPLSAFDLHVTPCITDIDNFGIVDINNVHTLMITTISIFDISNT